MVGATLRSKVITIMDPTAGPRGLNAIRKMKLAAAADLILRALFDCIQKFYSEWPVDELDWSKRFPILMDNYYSRDQSGIITTYLVTNFDGKDLTAPVCKDNINNHRQMLLHQVMMLEGNTKSLAEDHITTANINELTLSE